MFALAMLGGQTTFRVNLSANTAFWNLTTHLPAAAGKQCALYLHVFPAVTIQSISTATEAIDLTGLAAGSVVHLENEGFILGADDAGTGGTGIYAPYAGRLIITNGSGYIRSGNYPGGPAGYCIQYGADTVLQWVSGSSRTYGTIGT